ncbi:paired amphipathic helix protein Sin3a-like [Aphidius gifuensis]|uniref:paired amphipathic helix protein Sin3a-like n=1 Tax=Aphidius gifuensis TaxID=684658 RepID=UPI001CDB56A0|nr:paired amphipathic helix protein Sin3a-like [Aphidius gifuensis]
MIINPQLIVGLIAFQVPAAIYKIDVQGYAYQVSVSIPSEQSHCTVVSPPNQQPKVPSVIQIMSSGGNIHHSMANNISNSMNRNNMNIHPPSPEPLPSFNNSHVTSAHAQTVGNQAPSPVQDGASSSSVTLQNKLSEIDHAINYIDKIRKRFQGQPNKYNQFLKILQKYEEGKGAGASSKLTEAEVYVQVAELFENQQDLLLEFQLFLSGTANKSNDMPVVPQRHQVLSRKRKSPFSH